MLLVIEPDSEEERRVPASPEALRAALFPPELWYGAMLELRPAAPSAPRLSAVSVQDLFTAPEDEGLVSLGLEEPGGWYEAEPWLPRSEAAALMERFAAGDRGWIDGLVWKEVRDGRATGRYRSASPSAGPGDR